MILFWDTETTGIPLWGKPSEDPDQPHIVQLAMALVHPETREVVQTASVLVRPDGWEIPQEVVDIHGITTEIATVHGVPEAEMVAAYLAMRERATLEVGYNLTFDVRMMRIAKCRADGQKDDLPPLPSYDVCHPCTALCKLPPTNAMMRAGRKTFKTPKLTEAYAALIGEEMAGAHGAAADVRMTMVLYWYLKTQELRKNA